MSVIHPIKDVVPVRQVINSHCLTGTETNLMKLISHLRAEAGVFASALADEMGFIFEMRFSIIKNFFYFSCAKAHISRAKAHIEFVHANISRHRKVSYRICARKYIKTPQGVISINCLGKFISTSSSVCPSAKRTADMLADALYFHLEAKS